MFTINKKKSIDVKVIKLIDAAHVSISLCDIRSQLQLYSPDLINQAIRGFQIHGLIVIDNGIVTRTDKPYTII